MQARHHIADGVKRSGDEERSTFFLRSGERCIEVRLAFRIPTLAVRERARILGIPFALDGGRWSGGK